MHHFEAACFIMACIGLMVAALELLAVWRHFKANESQNGAPLPVSILKPVKGLDDRLFDNIESFCCQTHPAYEIIFTVDSAQDPACRVIRKIIAKYPGVAMSLVIGRPGQALNPKINSLLSGYAVSKYPLILISDSNVRADRDYLWQITALMNDPSVGLVTNPVRGIGHVRLAALFENLHLNSFILGSICLIFRFLNQSCVLGKSMLMRKPDLESIGGLRYFGNYLAEDYKIGVSMEESGRKVVLSTHVIETVNSYWNFSRFINRHTRWGKIRFNISKWTYMLELPLNSIFMAALGLAASGFSKPAEIEFFGVCLVKSTLDMLIGRMANCRIPMIYYMLHPLKDLLIGILFFAPFFSRTVVWRGNDYRIAADTALIPSEEDSEEGLEPVEIASLG